MTKKYLTESFNYHDLVDQIEPIVTVDEYSAQMGKDSEIVTLAFVVKNRQAGEDLTDWFERGYDYVLDAEVSNGEYKPGKYLVFVEMNRRSTVPERIIELISDMDTLTDMPVKDWTIIVDDEEYDPDIEILKQVITLSPHDYRVDKEKEEDLNDMRNIAGLENKNLHKDTEDAELKNFKSIAGL